MHHIKQVPLRYRNLSITGSCLNSRRRGEGGEETVIMANMMIDTSVYYSESLFYKASQFWHEKTTVGLLTDDNKKWNHITIVLQEPRASVDRIMRHKETRWVDVFREPFLFVSVWIDCVLENVHLLLLVVGVKGQIWRHGRIFLVSMLFPVAYQICV